MSKVLIIDDEASTVNVVTLLLKKHLPQVTEVYGAIGSAQGFQLIGEVKPDLVFLDVEMPLMNGFELLEEFPDHPFEVIFITAYDHYAIKAIKYSALDYLLKPVDAMELKQAVEKFLSRKTGVSRPLYDNLFYNLHQSGSTYRLAVSTNEGTFFYKASEIIRCEALGNYTRLFIKDKRSILASRTLKEYEDILPSGIFLRVHRTHLVNTDYITSYSRDFEVRMIDGTEIPVSRRRWDTVKHELLKVAGRQK
jgi:two-component system, LytTR family, response regulator